MYMLVGSWTFGGFILITVLLHLICLCIYRAHQGEDGEKKLVMVVVLVQFHERLNLMIVSFVRLAVFNFMQNVS